MKERLGFDLVLLGGPGSGKDTQARILQERYSLKPVESGKHWRAMAKKNNAEGRWLRRTMNRGQYTPVPLMKKFLKNQISTVSSNRDLIFVGNPRLKPEAWLLKKLLSEKRRDFFVLFIKLPEREVYRRLKKRLSKHEREDDSNLAYIKKRMQWQNPDTNKGIKYFQSINKLRFIKGDQRIKKVAQDIQKAIHDYHRSKKT